MGLWNAIKNFGQSVKETGGGYFTFIPDTLARLGFGTDVRPSAFELETQGFAQSPINYSVINKITEPASRLPWEFQHKEEGRELKSHKELDYLNLILRNPNPWNNWTECLYLLFTNYLVTGQTFLCVNRNEANIPIMIYVPRSSMVTITRNAMGAPTSYNVNIKGVGYTLPVTDVLHIKKPDISSEELYGLSPLVSLTNIWKGTNAMNRNEKLMHERHGSNSIMYLESSHMPAPDELQAMQDEITEKTNGSANVGKVTLLGQKVNKLDLSLSPKDLKLDVARLQHLRMTCATFNVPTMLAGDVGASTFSNMKEARISLFSTTIIPLVDYFSIEISEFFRKVFGIVDTVYYIDKKKVPELNELNLSESKKTIDELNAGILTQNEAREILHENLPPLTQTTNEDSRGDTEE